MHYVRLLKKQKGNMNGKVILHPSSRKAIVKTIMAEVRAIQNLRAVAKELKGVVRYSPEVQARIDALKAFKQTKEN